MIKQQKGRPRSESPMVHTAVVLPRDLLERLRTDAAASGHGLSTEIRQRLQLHYPAPEPAEQHDPKTNNLLRDIKQLSVFVAHIRGKKWHEHPRAFADFKEGVENVLARYEPEGDAMHSDRQGPGELDPPNVVGRILAGLTGTSPPSRLRAGHDENPDRKE